MTQPPIYDELARQDAEAAAQEAEARDPLAAYRHRYDTEQLIPGEQCPACGHVLPGRYDGSRNHKLRDDDVCTGMDLTRRHLSHAARRGDGLADCASRCIAAGWSAATVAAWLADPALIPSDRY